MKSAYLTEELIKLIILRFVSSYKEIPFEEDRIDSHIFKT